MTHSISIVYCGKSIVNGRQNSFGEAGNFEKFQILFLKMFRFLPMFLEVNLCE